MFGIITGSTCGDACWHAKEETCRCSCGGANHGCLLNAGTAQPVRTAKVQGILCELAAVGYDVETQAREINKAAGIDYVFAHTAREHYGYTPKALMRPATESQLARWPELAAYRGNSRETWRTNNPDKCAVHWPGLPYLLWVVKGKGE